MKAHQENKINLMKSRCWKAVSGLPHEAVNLKSIGKPSRNQFPNTINTFTAMWQRKKKERGQGEKRGGSSEGGLCWRSGGKHHDTLCRTPARRRKHPAVFLPNALLLQHFQCLFLKMVPKIAFLPFPAIVGSAPTPALSHRTFCAWKCFYLHRASG